VGKTVGSIRAHVKGGAGRQRGQHLVDCRLDWSIAEIMSCPQVEFTEMSAEPRLDVERMLRKPGTARTASSTGIVTSVVMRSRPEVAGNRR